MWHAQMEQQVVEAASRRLLEMVEKLYTQWSHVGALPAGTATFSMWLSHQVGRVMGGADAGGAHRGRGYSDDFDGEGAVAQGVAQGLRGGKGGDGGGSENGSDKEGDGSSSGVCWMDHTSGLLVMYDPSTSSFTAVQPDDVLGAGYNVLNPLTSPKRPHPSGSASHSFRGHSAHSRPRSSHPTQPLDHIRELPCHPYIDQSALTATTTAYVPIVSALANPPATASMQTPSTVAAPARDNAASLGSIGTSTSTSTSQVLSASVAPPSEAGNHPLPPAPYTALKVDTTAPPIPTPKCSRRCYGVLFHSREASGGDVLPPDFTQQEMQVMQHLARHVAAVLDASDGLDLN